ncbi:hypothetical protein D3C73_506530 [compost metagenome]
MLQVETLGIGAVQPLVEAGSGQVVGGGAVAQFQHAFGVHQRTDVIFVGKVQLAQIARQALQHLHGLGGDQVFGAELQVRAVLAMQQFPAIVGVQATAAARIKQVIGARHAQKKMPREIDPDQGDLQNSGQFQRNQSQSQWLPTSAFQHLAEQRRLRTQGRGIVLSKSQVIHAP